MHSWIRYSSFLVASSVAFTATAAVFPDVPDGHIFQVPIEQLVQTGVVNGNPDGSFYPDRAVNRAEMLKLLYLAEGIQPDASSRNCFSDVLVGSWYEPYICDAATRRFVAGYANGTFQPGQEVNRVEALKMVQEVFGFSVDDISEEEREVVQFVDVSVAAWYTKYLFNAFQIGILPIAGQDTSRFFPEAPLKRGEAAAMIYNALRAEIQEERKEIEEKAKEDEENVAEDEKRDNTVVSDTTIKEDKAVNTMTTEFPIDVSGKFDVKKSFSYYFDLNTTTTISTEVSLQNGQPGNIRCVLYLNDDTGFASEYYLGTQEDGKCLLLTTLVKGSYHLQIQPTEPNTTYTVVAKESSGDGNDGFSEAKNLHIGSPRTETLPQGNMQNWYKYQVNNPDGLRLKLDLTNNVNLSCVIYPMADVDIFGFNGPVCGQYYTYPSGTYYFAVTRKLPRGSKQTYTILLGN